MAILTGRLLVAGASNQIGATLAPLAVEAGWQVIGVSRRPRPSRWPGEWLQADLRQVSEWPCVDVWVHAAPLDAVPEAALTAQRLIAFSSTSAVTKRHSTSPSDRALAEYLRGGEAALMARASQCECPLDVLRPTMIWGCGRDANVTRVREGLRRWRVLPLVTRANGLRQPVHVIDLARAVLRLAECDLPAGHWLLPGGEALSYREFVARIQNSLTRRSWQLPLPLWMWRAACLAMGRRGQAVHAMLLRMRQNLDFATDDWERLGIAPRGFYPSEEDF